MVKGGKMAAFRKIDSLIPEASEEDIFGQHAVAAMRRILEIGEEAKKRGEKVDAYSAWLQEEVISPSWDDPDWCAMIAARLSDQVHTFPDDETITFRCHRCRDTGMYLIPSINKHGSVYEVSRWCEPCPWRLWAKAQWLKKKETEGWTRRGRLREGAE
jgi:hypothetical protein